MLPRCREVEEKPELEKEEMFDIYTRRYNFSPEDARSLVDVSFRNKDFFLRHMMVEELGILLADDDLTPSKKGACWRLMCLSILRVAYVLELLHFRCLSTSWFFRFLCGRTR